MQAQSTEAQRARTKGHGNLLLALDLLRTTAKEVKELGFAQTAAFLGRLIAGEALVQIVCRDCLVQAVHGLPGDLHPLYEDYEVLDYDDLKLKLYPEEIAEVYRRAGLKLPADAGEMRRRLPEAFVRLEWPSALEASGQTREIPPGKCRRARLQIGDWRPEATFPIVIVGGECYVFLGTPPEALPDQTDSESEKTSQKEV